MATRLQIFAVFFSSLLAAHSFGQSADGELVTRSFKVDSTAMWDLVSRATPGPVVDASSRPIFQQLLQARFAAAGIDFPENPFAPTLPTDKAMFVNERTGELVVRATREDLQQIEKIIEMMRRLPPIVEIEVRFVETPEVEAPIPFRSLPRGFTNLSVLTEKEFQETIRKYESSHGIDVLKTPKVTTLSGRQARVGVEQPNPGIYQDPPKLPRDTSPDADPTPQIKRRLPFPPGFVSREVVLIRSIAD